VRTLDAAGVERAILIAPFNDGHYSLRSSDSLRDANNHVAHLTQALPDRLFAFAVVNPLHDSAVDELDRAVSDLGVSGLKLFPSGWYPFDDRAHRIYERAADLGVPILFHSGIFIDGCSGRFCRPAFYEAIRDHPRLRVTLAHLGWPWCDEAIAVGLVDLLNHVEASKRQFRFDISFGPPPVYRLEALRKAISVLGAESLQFGSDQFLPCSGEIIRTKVVETNELFTRLEVSQRERDQMMAGTAAEWLKI
jgi:predicted TIM-barrel fold metal-dependent hydrolase